MTRYKTKTSVDLKELNNMLDEALEKETTESLNKLLFDEDSKDTVIQGWVARDKSGDLYMYHAKPLRNMATDRWRGEISEIDLYNNLLFPDLTWSDDPIEVEIIIKIKKNG